jgi:hypothetical protein
VSYKASSDNVRLLSIEQRDKDGKFGLPYEVAVLFSQPNPEYEVLIWLGLDGVAVYFDGFVEAIDADGNTESFSHDDLPDDAPDEAYNPPLVVEAMKTVKNLLAFRAIHSFLHMAEKVTFE